MLGRWQAWARSWADPGADAIKDNLEYNARNQLTLWGPTGQINDYVRISDHCAAHEYHPVDLTEGGGDALCCPNQWNL